MPIYINEVYSSSWFYYNNLLAFDKSGVQNKEGFFNCLIQGYEQKGYTATSRFLSLMQGKNIEEKESPFESVTSFQDILVEIYVNRTYEDKYKIKRKDHAFGSGFLINNTYIVTAFHIIESCFAVETKKFLINIKKGERIAKKVKIKLGILLLILHSWKLKMRNSMCREKLYITIDETVNPDDFKLKDLYKVYENMITSDETKN